MIILKRQVVLESGDSDTRHGFLSLRPGTRIGAYEVAGPLGEGGMGQVYRACDAKLERDVAIKVLPDALAHDADRRGSRAKPRRSRR